MNFLPFAVVVDLSAAVHVLPMLGAVEGASVDRKPNTKGSIPYPVSGHFNTCSTLYPLTGRQCNCGESNKVNASLIALEVILQPSVKGRICWALRTFLTRSDLV